MVHGRSVAGRTDYRGRIAMSRIDIRFDRSGDIEIERSVEVGTARIAVHEQGREGEITCFRVDDCEGWIGPCSARLRDFIWYKKWSEDTRFGYLSGLRPTLASSRDATREASGGGHESGFRWSRNRPDPLTDHARKNRFGVRA